MLIKYCIWLFLHANWSFCSKSRDSLPECNWAQNYDINDLLHNTSLQEEVMTSASWWGGKFADDAIGIVYETGMTRIHVPIDSETGLPLITDPPQTTDDVSESTHLALLALALTNATYSTLFFQSSMEMLNYTDSVQEFVVEQLKRKIDCYEKYHKRFPGKGGFFHLFTFVAQSDIPSEPDPDVFHTSLQVAWAMLAVVQAFRNLNDSQYTEIEERYHNYATMLMNNVLEMFYVQEGDQILGGQSEPGLYTMVIVHNASDEMSASNRWIATLPISDKPLAEYDLMVYFAYLFGNWTPIGGNETRNVTLTQKRRWLNATDYLCYDLKNTKITVERGVYFGADERQKYLYLPYLDSADNERFFLNGERVRTWHSWLKKYPGLFAYSMAYGPVLDKLSHTGIKEVAYYEEDNVKDTITPYAAFPMFLHNATRGYGVAWYVAMLRAGKMQGPYGATWSAKLSGKYAEFLSIVNNDYEHIYNPSQFHGEENEYKLPSEMFPTTGPRFTTCATRDSTLSRPQLQSNNGMKNFFKQTLEFFACLLV